MKYWHVCYAHHTRGTHGELTIESMVTNENPIAAFVRASKLNGDAHANSTLISWHEITEAEYELLRD